MDCFHFTIKCFTGDVKEQSKHWCFAQEAPFQWVLAKQGKA